MSLDPRTPVIIGAAQVSQRRADHDDPALACDAIDLMTEAARAAATDTSVSGSIEALQSIAVVGGLWSHHDPGRLIARQIGASPPHTALTEFGGQMPISLIGHLAQEIAFGRLDAGMMVGGESAATRRRLRQVGLKPMARPEPPGTERTTWGPILDMGDPITLERGGSLPVNFYAILDSVMRERNGETITVGRQRAAAMWERYAGVAAGNPHAADRSSPSAEFILEPSPDNRMVSWPYTKAMCANNRVDMAGAVIITSTELADRLGVPTDRRVHPKFGLEASDTAEPLARDRVDSVPGLQAVSKELRRRVGDAADIPHLDIYACFPSIVDLAFETLGLDPSATPTVTGGLAFAGAPLNFAAGQSLVAMIHTLRADPGSLGLVHGNGGNAAKHAIAVLGTNPPSGRFDLTDCGSHPARREIAAPDAVADVVIDGFTVEHDKDGPSRAIVACRLEDGSRCWATTADQEVMSSLMSDEMVGASGRVASGRLTL